MCIIFFYLFIQSHKTCCFIPMMYCNLIIMIIVRAKFSTQEEKSKNRKSSKPLIDKKIKFSKK